MDHFMDAETQTDPVLVLSLAHAAILGLLTENELFGASIKPNGFFSENVHESDINRHYNGTDCFKTELDSSVGIVEERGQHREEVNIDNEIGLTFTEKQTRRRKRQPVKLLPKSKSQRTKEVSPAHATVEASELGQEDANEGQTAETIPAEEVKIKMIDLSAYRRKSLRLHPAPESPRNSFIGGFSSLGFQESYEASRGKVIAADPPESTAAQELPGLSSSAVNPGNLEMLDTGKENEQQQQQQMVVQNFVWQEQMDFEEESAAEQVDRNRRAQMDRLDINVQIDDSYLVDMGDGHKRWHCRLCEKSYTSKYNLVTHILGHNGIKPHACPHCTKLFKQPSHLQTHLLTHGGKRPHKCEVCGKAFTQTSHLKRHMLQHTDIKPYSCRFCGRGFAYPSEHRSHEAKHESGRCHVCIECGLDFATLTQLKRHLTSHQGPSPYHCVECNKSFHYRSQLQNHLLKHQNVRPFVCKECGMEFTQIHHLKQHSLTHKGVKEFKCEVCGREFTLHANMKRHMLIHNSVRPYQCHICFKTFVQKQTLKTHMIVHSPVKPFKCKECGKAFNRMYNLLGHMHLHAGNKPFKCPYCSSKFNLKGNLSRHMKVKHGVMEVALDGPDNLMDFSGVEQPEVEGHQEMEDFDEENSYDCRGGENMPEESTVENCTLTEDVMTEMAYYAFDKETRTQRVDFKP